MSLVGPRPLVLDEDCRIEGWRRSRLELAPGVTGPWQVFGSARIPLNEMVKIDYLYGANWSLWLDVKTLLRTVPFVLGRRGAVRPPAGDAPPSACSGPRKSGDPPRGVRESYGLGRRQEQAEEQGEERGAAQSRFARRRSFRDQLSAVLTAGGHAVLARSTTGEGLLASCNGRSPACVVIAADRPDRATLEIVRLVRSKLGRVPAVLVCRHAVVGDVRRALELGVDGVILGEDAEEALAAVVAAVCAASVGAQWTAQGGSGAGADNPREADSDADGHGTDQLTDRVRAVPRGEHRQEPSVLGLWQARRLISQ